MEKCDQKQNLKHPKPKSVLLAYLALTQSSIRLREDFVTIEFEFEKVACFETDACHVETAMHTEHGEHIHNRRTLQNKPPMMNTCCLRLTTSKSPPVPAACLNLISQWCECHVAWNARPLK